MFLVNSNSHCSALTLPLFCAASYNSHLLSLKYNHLLLASLRFNVNSVASELINPHSIHRIVRKSQTPICYFRNNEKTLYLPSSLSSLIELDQSKTEKEIAKRALPDFFDLFLKRYANLKAFILSTFILF